MRQVIAWSALPGVLTMVFVVAAVKDSPRVKPPSAPVQFGLAPSRASGDSCWPRSCSRSATLRTRSCCGARASSAWRSARPRALGAPPRHARGHRDLGWRAQRSSRPTVRHRLRLAGLRGDLRRVRRGALSWQAWLLFAMYGTYYGLTEGAQKALVVDLVPSEWRGRALGALQMAIGLAVLPASVLFGPPTSGGAGAASASAVVLPLRPPCWSPPRPRMSRPRLDRTKQAPHSRGLRCLRALSLTVVRGGSMKGRRRRETGSRRGRRTATARPTICNARSCRSPIASTSASRPSTPRIRTPSIRRSAAAPADGRAERARSSCSTTSASAPRARSAGRATRPPPSGWRRTASSTPASTPPRCARRRAQALLTGRNHHSVGMGAITEMATSAPGNSSVRPKEQGAAGRDPEAERLLDRAVRQVPRGADVGDQPDGPFDQLADRLGVRVLLRLRRRRGEPVLPGALRGHDRGRAAEDARGGLHAQRGSRRPRDQLGAPAEGADARQAVLHVLRARRHARTAPRAEGVVGQVQGQVRRGLGRAARGDVRAAEEAGRDPGGRRADAAARGDPGVGRHAGRAEAGARAPDGDLRRLPRADRPPRRPRRRRARRSRRPRRHAGLLHHRRQRRVGRGHAERLLQRDDHAERHARDRDDRVPADKIDDFGTPDAYNHYAVGWAHAMCTPYQWTKQVASHWGGTRNGTIVHWPDGIDGQGRDRATSSTT